MHKVFSAALSRIKPELINIEVDSASGLPAFSIVGLPDKAVSESKDRIRAAIKHAGGQFPQKKVTVNLAPASIKKEGAGYDLGMAAAILISSKQIPELPAEVVFLGELSLSGEVLPVRGLIALISGLYMQNPKLIFAIPASQQKSASLIRGATILPVENLAGLMTMARGEREFRTFTAKGHGSRAEASGLDFAHLRGLAGAKRAFEIAAAGGHHVLMSGPPGVGKTLLARAFTSILPPMSMSELLEANSIHSAAGYLADTEYLDSRPFRSPHHTASSVALVGSDAKPGEITLAHHGVLFMDELPEFRRDVLEALREPLEENRITISRARNYATYPASFQLIAAKNPCPCGNYGSTKNACMCPTASLIRYQKKVSAALLDRIDINITLDRYDGDIFQPLAAESSAAILSRVIRARELQSKRFGRPITNSKIGHVDLAKSANLEPEAETILNAARTKMELSLRAVHKIIRIARTIADLAGSEATSSAHVAEAIQYRFAREGETAII